MEHRDRRVVLDTEYAASVEGAMRSHLTSKVVLKAIVESRDNRKWIQRGVSPSSIDQNQYHQHGRLPVGPPKLQLTAT